VTRRDISARSRWFDRFLKPMPHLIIFTIACLVGVALLLVL